MFSTILINIYCESTELSLANSLFSQEGTTQGDLTSSVDTYSSISPNASIESLAISHVAHSLVPRLHFSGSPEKDCSRSMQHKIVLQDCELEDDQPLAMPFYTLAMQPLIDSLSRDTSKLRQIWYADDATAG